MNNPRKVFKTLSDLYQFHKKLIKAYPIQKASPTRVAEPRTTTGPGPWAGPDSEANLSEV